MHAPRGRSAATGSKPTSRIPTAVCEPQSSPVFCHCLAPLCHLQPAPPAVNLYAPGTNPITGFHWCTPMARPSSHSNAHQQQGPLHLQCPGPCCLPWCLSLYMCWQLAPATYRHLQLAPADKHVYTSLATNTSCGVHKPLDLGALLRVPTALSGSMDPTVLAKDHAVVILWTLMA